MAHPADFSDAHDRHWEDAELLYDNERWANADQSYGFSAECGLKAVMLSHGMPVDATGTPTEDAHRKHAHELWETCKAFLQGRLAAQYLRLLPAGVPFDDWSHHDRYAHRRHFEEANVNPHRQAARAIRGMMQTLRQDGRI